MNIKSIVSAAAAAVLIAGIPVSARAEKAKKTKIKTRSELVRENRKYAAAIDSLKKEISRINEEMALRDSLATEIMDIYEGESENRIEYNAEVTDSLLSIWYMHQSIDESRDPEYDMDSVRFSSNVPDSVYIRRIKDMNSFIQLPYNEIVRNYIILYSEKMPNKIGTIMGLCKFYMPMFDEIFNEHDLPEELKTLAVIESALNPTAVSRAGAKGMWQFMYSTAKRYGLTINSFVDERMDPVASAHAAARYLKDAYEIFGDWNLAIASYNCGAGNVNKAIRRSGGKRTFWDIYPYLPKETRGYVPSFVGALYTMTYYKEHGIVPESAPLPPVIDTLKINKMLHFKQVEALTGLSVQEQRNLNPQYRHDIVPGNEREYIYRIPFNYVNAFIDAKDSLYTYKSEEYFNPVSIKKIKDGGDGRRIVYKVRSGDVLGKIASRHHVSVAQIKRWNNLRSNTIRIGQRLVIYTGNSAPEASSSKSSSSSKPAASSNKKPQTSGSGKPSINPGLPYTTYVVKKGDTLYEIAKKYPGVSAKNIMDFNKIGSDIRPGATIRIPKL